MENLNTMTCHRTDNMSFITLLVMIRIKVSHEVDVYCRYYDSEICTMKLFSSMLILQDC